MHVSTIATFPTLLGLSAMLFLETTTKGVVNAFVIPTRVVTADDSSLRRATLPGPGGGGGVKRLTERNVMVADAVPLLQQQDESTTMDTSRSFSSSSSSSSALFTFRRREQLKRDILRLADEYNHQVQSGQTLPQQQVAQEKNQTDQEKSYVQRLLQSRIVQKINPKPNATTNRKSKASTIIRRESLGTSQINTGTKGQAILQLAQELAKLNPTSAPLYGWKGRVGGGSSSSSGGNPLSTTDCKLNGTWTLRFTTAADATFATNHRRGQAQTRQEINAATGTLTNVVQFEKGKLRGFRVVVAGHAVSDTRMDLSFRRVVLLRNSRFPRLLGKVVIPLPARLLRWINRISMRQQQQETSRNKQGPYFEVQYVDDNFRMHKTGEGNWFIQSRVV